MSQEVSQPRPRSERAADLERGPLGAVAVGHLLERAHARRTARVDLELLSLYDRSVELRSSASKHGCGADDILHAVANALAIYEDLDDPFVLYLGPDSTGALLEVMTAVDDHGEEIAFHAMPMRRKYRSLLA